MILWRSKNALRIPIAAIFRGPDKKWQAFKNDAGRARLTTVELDHMTDEYAEVTKGLLEGDEIVLNPPTTLRDGDRISLRR